MDIAPYAPRGTEVDSFDGRCLVSVVGLLFRNTRVAGLSIPGHRNFEEVNLRLYVRRAHSGVRRRGVVFIKELVPLRAVAWTARLLYGERYEAVAMRHRAELSDGRRSVVYEWHRRGAKGRIDVTAAGEPAEIDAGTEEEFVADHHWGYVGRGDRPTLEYRVEHPRWRIWRTESACFQCDAGRFYGDRFGSILGNAPLSAFLAEGSAVEVHRPEVLHA